MEEHAGTSNVSIVSITALGFNTRKQTKLWLLHVERISIKLTTASIRDGLRTNQFSSSLSVLSLLFLHGNH